MTETILIPFVSPDVEIVQAFPYKFILSEYTLEFYTKSTVIEIEESTELPIEKTYDSRTKMFKEAIAGLCIYKSNSYKGYYIFKLHNATGEISIYLNSKQDAVDLYNQLDKWIFYANS